MNDCYRLVFLKTKCCQWLVNYIFRCKLVIDNMWLIDISWMLFVIYEMFTWNFYRWVFYIDKMWSVISAGSCLIQELVNNVWRLMFCTEKDWSIISADSSVVFDGILLTHFYRLVFVKEKISLFNIYRWVFNAEMIWSVNSAWGCLLQERGDLLYPIYKKLLMNLNCWVVVIDIMLLSHVYMCMLVIDEMAPFNTQWWLM